MCYKRKILMIIVLALIMTMLNAGFIQASNQDSGVRTIYFSDRTWSVKSSGGGKVGPGPNHFSDSDESVWVDQEGFLHMKVRKINGVWHSAEVVLDQSLGYGRYVVYTTSRIDLLDKNIVLGIFTYDNSAPEVNYRQLDIEVSKWGDANIDNGQFVAQTNKPVENVLRFPVQLTGDYVSHVIDWRTDRIYFQMIHGHHSFAPDYGYFIKEWTYPYPVPKGNQKLIINFWQVQGMDPSNGEEAEVVIKYFQFIRT